MPFISTPSFGTRLQKAACQLIITLDEQALRVAQHVLERYLLQLFFFFYTIFCISYAISLEPTASPNCGNLCI